jgi:dTDP-4-amino-4,6-dideoxygalactose transaminase
MISYIYGAKFDATEIIEWCHSKGIFIFEDQAESFDNPSIKSTSIYYYIVHPKVDFATFSFGTIKTCSAFGGSISIIRNNEVLYRKMLAIQDAYPYLSKGL